MVANFKTLTQQTKSFYIYGATLKAMNHFVSENLESDLFLPCGQDLQSCGCFPGALS